MPPSPHRTWPALLLLAGSAVAQVGAPDFGEDLTTAVGAGEETPDRRKLTIIENIPLTDGAWYGKPVEGFVRRGLEVALEKDVTEERLLELVQDTDILWVFAHGGLDPEGDRAYRLRWYTHLYTREHKLYAHELAAALEGRPGPAVTLLTACRAGLDEELARALGGTVVGFEEEINIHLGWSWSWAFLNRIAEGLSVEQALEQVPPEKYSVGGRSGSRGGLKVFRFPRRASP